MAIGARDYIDKMLVKKYATERVDSEVQDSKVSPDDVMKMMNAYSYMRNGTNVNLQKLCGAVVAKTAYRNSAYLNTQKERERLTAS